MSLDTIIKKIGRGMDKTKQYLEPGIDKVLLFGALNTAAVYKAMEAIDKSDLSDPTNNLLMIGTGAALTAADYYLFVSPKTKKIRRLIGMVNKKIDKNRIASWVKTGILMGGLIWGSQGLKPYAKQIKTDIASHLKTDKEVVLVEEKEETTQPIITFQSLKKRPEFYDKLDYKYKAKHDFSGTKLAPKDSDIGRIQRTLRWQPIYRTIEEARGIKKDTLAGMIMQESYGDPVQPNAKGDGGLGLMHIQGTTARSYGLKIYGNSNKASDFNHGRQISNIIKQCEYDPTCIQEYDERVHFVKNLDAGARIIKEGIKKHGKWEYGVEYYRAPGWIGRNTTWLYMARVSKWMEKIQNQNLISKAAIDFEQRNGYPFKEYINKWHEMNYNWDLETYVASMPGIKKPAKSIADQIPTINQSREILNQARAQSSAQAKVKEDEWIYYTAKKGDTVWGITHRIAKKRVDMDQFKKQNQIHQNKIVPGKEYKLYKR